MIGMIKKYIKKDPKAYVILLICLVSPMSLVIPMKNSFFFNLKSVSPLPIVFSQRPTLEKRYVEYLFDFYSDDNSFVTKKFNRKYYKNLPGPHRYKLFHFTFLKRNSFIANPKNQIFYNEIFCKYPEVRNAFEIKFEVQKVIIKDQQKVVYEIICSE